MDLLKYKDSEASLAPCDMLASVIWYVFAIFIGAHFSSPLVRQTKHQPLLKEKRCPQLARSVRQIVGVGIGNKHC